MLCFHRDLRATISMNVWSWTWKEMIPHLSFTPFASWFSSFLSFSFSFCCDIRQYKDAFKNRGYKVPPHTPFEASLLTMVPPVSLIWWNFALSPISDEGQITVIPHKLCSIIFWLTLKLKKLLKADRLTETRGLWLKVLTQYLFHSIASRSLSRLDLNTSTSSW